MRAISRTFTRDSDAERRSPDREDDQTRRPDRVPVPFKMVRGAEGSEAIPVPNIARSTFGLSIVRGSR